MKNKIPNEEFKFILTKEQEKIVLPALENAEHDGFKKHQYGMVLCQIARTNGEGEVSICGAYFKKPIADKIFKFMGGK